MNSFRGQELYIVEKVLRISMTYIIKEKLSVKWEGTLEELRVW